MSVQVSSEQMATLKATLLNTPGNVPLHERFRALFMLKAVGGDEVVDIVSEGLKDPSPLLKHELAYILGQLLNTRALPTLSRVLENPTGEHCSMVRHEAAEALGAIGAEESLPILRKYMQDENREVRETCEVAVGKIEFDLSDEGKKTNAKTSPLLTPPLPPPLPTFLPSAPTFLILPSPSSSGTAPCLRSVTLVPAPKRLLKPLPMVSETAVPFSVMRLPTSLARFPAHTPSLRFYPG
ncbi:deoxyhypusine hydroxylase [Cryptococcus neoformans]|nr:deoxyhypusine hydroxylase [Cryptococcus neoformans var. grubii]